MNDCSSNGQKDHRIFLQGKVLKYTNPDGVTEPWNRPIVDLYVLAHCACATGLCQRAQSSQSTSFFPDPRRVIVYFLFAVGQVRWGNSRLNIHGGGVRDRVKGCCFKVARELVLQFPCPPVACQNLSRLLLFPYCRLWLFCVFLFYFSEALN